ETANLNDLLPLPLSTLFLGLLYRNLQAPQKKVAKAPGASKAGKKTANPLFEARPKSFGIGQSVRHQTDLTRFVKWPEYVRLQR
ncbi:hypothetical protein, partial [Klebsiella pneumoniae]|uniref:hypothetical protein n=1 Tax=Klebsiella pneumoniae TaxID=573 RepID=UPI0030138CCB